MLHMEGFEQKQNMLVIVSSLK